MSVSSSFCSTMGSILRAALSPSIERRCESPLRCGGAERNCFRFEVPDETRPLTRADAFPPSIPRGLDLVPASAGGGDLIHAFDWYLQADRYPRCTASSRRT